MKWGPENLDVFQNLEHSVISIWRRHRDMTDHVAGRAYQAAFDHYRAEARDRLPKPCSLTGLDREVFDAVLRMCEFRLGRGTLEGAPSKPIPPVPVSQIVDCLRELTRSVERHTKLGGRQGYLTFVDGFLA